MSIVLRVNGTDLPLPPGLRMTREIETTIFNREITVTDFTYPCDIPLTDDAIVALGFPTSIANPALKQDYYADFIVNGIYVDYVVLRILRVSLKNKTASVSIIGKYGAFARLYNGKKVNELSLGGTRSVGGVNGAFLILTSALPITNYFVQYKGNNVATHINAVNKGTLVTDYVFGQAMDTSNTLAMQGSGVNVLNGWAFQNFVGPGFTAGVRDPVHNYLLDHLHDITTAPTNDIQDRWWWVPQFRLHYVLRKCMEEQGFTVTGSIFSDAMFQRITLYNTYCINRCSFSYTVSAGKGTLSVTHDATQINPRNHVPALPIVEFLQEAGKAFNLHYDINLRNMTIDVRQVAAAASYGSTIDLSGIATPLPELNFEEQEYSRGFDYSFADVSEAQVNEDYLKYPMRGQYYTADSLSGIPSPATNDIAYVLAENAYYQYNGFEWGFFSDNLGHYKSSTRDNLMQISTSLAPIALRKDPLPLFEATSGGFVHYDTGALEVNPVSNIGICGSGIFTFDFDRLGTTGGNADKLATCFYLVNVAPIDHAPRIMNWAGMRPITGQPAGVNYPLLTSMANDAQGMPISLYVLAWHTYGLYGLYDVWWANLVTELAGCIETEYEVLLDALTLNNVDWNSNVFLINGLRYLCKKASIVLPLPDVATLTLVRV